MAQIKLVILDVAGTTAQDDGLVVKAFQMAMKTTHPTSTELAEMTDYVIATMGQRKIDVFTHLCEGDHDKALAAHERFIKSYTNLVIDGELQEFDGVSDFFGKLRKRGVGIGLTTGFPREILDPIISELGWRDLIDFSVAASEVEEGRPAPDMILRTLEMYNQSHGTNLDCDQVAVAGDTQSDMKAGVSSGAAVVLGVTSGAHSGAELRASGATEISSTVLTLLNFLD